MIALLSAVAEETDLIRAAMTDLSAETAHGLSFYRGKLSGQDVCLAHSGIGKAAAASTAACLILYCRPESLWLFGCGGAYPDSGFKIGDLVAADYEVFGDEGTETVSDFQDLADMKLPMRDNGTTSYNRWPTDPDCLAWARSVLPELRPGTFVTVSCCTGTASRAHDLESRTAGVCENMEGAAVALVCQQLSVPLLELRGISNIVEDRDLKKWDLPAGMNTAQEAILKLLSARQKG